MKKKLFIILVMLIVCAGLFTLAQKAQSSILNKKSKIEAAAPSENSETKKVADNNAETNKAAETPKVENKEQTSAAASSESKSNVSNSSNSTNGSDTEKSTSKQTTPTPPASTRDTQGATTPKTVVPVAPDKDNNFAIIDEVNNTILLQRKIDFDNVTIDFITCRLLKAAGIDYGNEDEGTATSYFYSIGGLTERKSGKLSGWCFYVNGKKPGMGAGSYIYHRGDVVIWRYKKDAVNN